MQVGTVDVTGRPTKHVQGTIDDGHGLQGNRENSQEGHVAAAPEKGFPPSRSKALLAKLYPQIPELCVQKIYKGQTKKMHKV